MLIDCLERSLTLAIPKSSVKEHSKSDLSRLMESYGILENAKNAFLAQEISFEEYIELCEIHNVNVDSYLSNIEYNLTALKLI